VPDFASGLQLGDYPPEYGLLRFHEPLQVVLIGHGHASMRDMTILRPSIRHGINAMALSGHLWHCSIALRRALHRHFEAGRAADVRPGIAPIALSVAGAAPRIANMPAA
jgi:hypothetical protein